MIDDTSDETADVSVEKVSGGYGLQPSRPPLTPNLTPLPLLDSNADAGPTPTATPTPNPNYKNTKWPDGRILTHPEHFVNTGVVNVKPRDTLKLRSKPDTKSKIVTEIPSNGTDITAFDQDQVWDGHS
jgi:hypothetical protein